MLTQQEQKFLSEKLSRRYLWVRRVALILGLLLFSAAMYMHYEYLALAAIIGIIIRQIYETWNGDPLISILNKLVDQAEDRKG